ncbi:zinc finger and SCAN domain-containing protein 2-like isoform X6 [Anguilla anguilla]|uniref:zinc finger and SCAN domain-containing protein 2-like isoform X6 n=1 Tax=Anguilla anguilla TaxID=7936 RepID=UPI0015AF3FD1|nr:zinc finger and SCAN domain-containing protein 2-like isoform X6 [Anguilla anguilla]
MSDCVNLHTQLAYILDALANKALEEICKVVDDGYAVLRFEVSRHQKENEVLKRKLQMMALKSVQCSAERTATHTTANAVEVCHTLSGATVERAFGRRERSQRRDGETTNLDDDEDDPETQDVVAKEEDGRPELLIIKEERREDDQGISEPLGVETVRGDRAVEWRAGSREKRPVEETQNKAANHTEQHRTRRAVWEVSGLESVLKAEGQSECVETLQHRGAEHRAGGLNSLDSEFVMFERPGQLGSYCTQGGAVTETEDPCCSYSAEMDPEGLLGPFTEGQDRSGCDMNFSTSDSVQTHLGDIAGKKPIVCKYCGRGFARRNALEIHQRVHTGEKPFSCLQCGKQFAHSGNLKVHQSVHTGERRFRCALCGKRFISSSHLKRHWSVHTRERPFSCAQCGKRFSDAGSRKRHQSVHTGRTAFACAPCGRRFASSGHLRRHRLQVHVPDGAVEDPWPQGENEPL